MPVITMLMLLALIAELSFLAIQGYETPPWSRFIAFRPNASLGGEELSIRSEEWPLDTLGVIGAELSGANLRYAKADSAFLVRAILVGADMTGASLRGADLRGAHLERAVVIGADLEGADLTSANLHRAVMQGSNLGGATLEAVYGRHAILTKDSLRDANLRKARLDFVNLNAAHLAYADLQEAFLYAASLKNANMRGSDLRGANFELADLRSADLLDVFGWDEVEKVYAANLFGVRNPPSGFIEWALRRGAVCVDAIVPTVFEDGYAAEPGGAPKPAVGQGVDTLWLHRHLQELYSLPSADDREERCGVLRDTGN